MKETFIRQVWTKIIKARKDLKLYLYREVRIALVAYTCPKFIRCLTAKWHARKRPNLAIFSDKLSQIPKDQLKRVVLFVAVDPHSRESRLARVAKHAGWTPILAYCGQREHAEPNLFFLHFRFENTIELLLASWLYRGPLTHIFALSGDFAYPLVRLRNQRAVLDIYDTYSGIAGASLRSIINERKAVKMTDGLIHRDRRLEIFYGKEISNKDSFSAFIPDPLPEKLEITPKCKTDEIHVVSCGWVDEKENSILRVARKLCAAKIHVHVFFNPFQLSTPHLLLSYFRLEKKSDYFHIEKPLFGEEYRCHLTCYDFGLAVFEPDLFKEPFSAYSRDYVRGCGSSRLADYIHAGLGVIISPLLEFQSEVAHQYAPICVEAKKDFLDNPRKILEDAMSRKKKVSPQKLEELTAKGMADRLHTLYSKILKKGFIRRVWNRIKRDRKALKNYFLREARIELIAYTCPKVVRRLIAKWYTRKSTNLAIFADRLSKIPKAQFKDIVLFVSPKLHSREARLASVAKSAGWSPILVYLGQEERVEEEQFSLHFRFDNLVELLLACWLFNGSLIHLFVFNGDYAYPFVRLKNKKVILDMYDTCSGISVYLKRALKNEKKAVEMTDGLTQRDGRLEFYFGKYVRKKNKSLAFMPDPFPEKPMIHPKREKNNEIHVVSGGWVDEQENSIVRFAQALCEAEIHVHLYLHPFQLSKPETLSSYFELNKRSDYFHIEKPLYGAEFRHSLRIYDFGLAVFEPDLFQESYEIFHRDHVRTCGSSRLADYIYAGLGVIISPLIEFQRELANQYAPVVVDATKDFLADPRRHLEEAMSRRRVIPPEKMEELTASGMADRLHTLYSELS